MQHNNGVNNNIYNFGQKEGWGSMAVGFQSNSVIISNGSSCIPSGE